MCEPPEAVMLLTLLDNLNHEIVTVEEIADVKKENTSSTPTDIDYVQVWADIRNIRKHFKWKGFAMNMSFGLAPSAWDITTDFKFSEKLSNISSDSDISYYSRDRLVFLSLLFISTPGIVFFATLLQQALERCTKHCKCSSVLKTLCTNILSLGFVAAVIVGLGMLLVLAGSKDSLRDSSRYSSSLLICKILALTAATGILMIKTLHVFVLTENIKRMSLKATSYEGSYESSLQLFLILLVGLKYNQDLDKMALASSLVMIAKSGAESHLTFGSVNKLSDERSILSKLRKLGKFIPVFLVTGYFRVGTMAVCMTWDWELMVLILLPLALALPLIVVLLAKLCGQLPHLSLTEIVQGLIGELTSIVLWGTTGTEGSRKIQLWVGGYLLLLYTVVLGLVLAFPHGLFGRGGDIPLEMPAMLLASGWIGYGLFIYQVYLFNRYNMDWRKKIHLMGNTLAGH